MIRIAVVDDENIVCTQLERLINEAADIISITVEIDIYSSSEAFVKILKANEKYDLIFLDIELVRIYGGQSDLFKYKINRDTFYANINEILYFKSDDRRILIVKESGDEEFYGTIENVYTQLKDRGFFIPHRSYLVNYRFIRGFQAKIIIMTNDTQIPISDNRRKEIFKIQLMLENGD